MLVDNMYMTSSVCEADKRQDNSDEDQKRKQIYQLS